MLKQQYWPSHFSAAVSDKEIERPCIGACPTSEQPLQHAQYLAIRTLTVHADGQRCLAHQAQDEPFFASDIDTNAAKRWTLAVQNAGNFELSIRASLIEEIIRRAEHVPNLHHLNAPMLGLAQVLETAAEQVVSQNETEFHHTAAVMLHRARAVYQEVLVLQRELQPVLKQFAEPERRAAAVDAPLGSSHVDHANTLLSAADCARKAALVSGGTASSEVALGQDCLQLALAAHRLLIAILAGSGASSVGSAPDEEPLERTVRLGAERLLSKARLLLEPEQHASKASACTVKNVRKAAVSPAAEASKKVFRKRKLTQRIE